MLALLLEVVDLLLGQDFVLLAVAEGGFGEQMDLDRVFEVDEGRALGAIRVQLRMGQFLADASGADGRAAYRVEARRIGLESVHDVLSVCLEQDLALGTRGEGRWEH